MPSTRTEAFSDGVFAVAITLLVFNVQIPDTRSGGLAHALTAQWPSYASYVVSFLTIGIIWVNHHGVFRYIEEVDRPLQFFNLLLLMCVAFIPFPTALLGRYIEAGHDAELAAAVYGGVMTVMALAFSLVWAYAATHPQLLSARVDRQRVRGTIPRFGAGTVVYALAAGTALINAKLSLAIYALLPLFYVFDQVQLPLVEDGPHCEMPASAQATRDGRAGG